MRAVIAITLTLFKAAPILPTPGSPPRVSTPKFPFIPSRSFQPLGQYPLKFLCVHVWEVVKTALARNQNIGCHLAVCLLASSFPFLGSDFMTAHGANSWQPFTSLCLAILGSLWPSSHGCRETYTSSYPIVLWGMHPTFQDQSSILQQIGESSAWGSCGAQRGRKAGVEWSCCDTGWPHV